jgi:hypothetical protein
MAKFHGMIGFAIGNTSGTGAEEGVVKELPVIERAYFGDVLRNTRRYEQGSDINDDLNISNRISIVADAYANEHFFAMKYVWWMGARWKVTDIEVQRPRLILTVGGVYNGPTA